MFDVAIIGGGVTGCAVAMELAKYQLSVILIEREEDVATGGATKANSAIIHAGYDPMPGTLKAKLNVAGNAMYSELCKRLDIPFKRIGSLVLAFNDEDVMTLHQLYERGIANGVPDMKILVKNELFEMEANISEKAVAALYAPTAGVICPYEATIAFYENARDNGVEFLFDNEVVSITKKDVFSIQTQSKSLTARYIVNAAGVYSDEISQMANAETFHITPRKGEYILMDKSQGNIVNHVIFQVPTKYGKGILVTPTVDGNLLIGPNAQDIDEREGNLTTEKGLNEVISGARKSVPGFDLKDRITNFAGVRAVPDSGDFIIGESSKVPGFINAAGIESPGLTSAPAIAVMIKDILKQSGLDLIEKKDYKDTRHVVRFRDMSNEERAELIAKNPKYGRVICRCETVTEGEIVDAIKRGARSVDGVKRRTRAGMGRCQGGFCAPRVMEILSRELNIPMDKVTKSGAGSNMLVARLKELILRGENNA